MDDLIDRGSLVLLLNEAQIEGDEFYKGLGRAKNIVCDIPTVEAKKVVRAWWIEVGHNSGAKILRCTNCQNTVLKNYSPKFCEHCGAQMWGAE